MTSLMLALDLIHVSPYPDDALGITCPHCHDALEVHQPDVQLHERLLGTCAGCRTWFLIDAAEHLMVRLPNEGDLRDG